MVTTLKLLGVWLLLFAVIAASPASAGRKEGPVIDEVCLEVEQALQTPLNCDELLADAPPNPFLDCSF